MHFFAFKNTRPKILRHSPQCVLIPMSARCLNDLINRFEQFTGYRILTIVMQIVNTSRCNNQYISRCCFVFNRACGLSPLRRRCAKERQTFTISTCLMRWTKPQSREMLFILVEAHRQTGGNIGPSFRLWDFGWRETVQYFNCISCRELQSWYLKLLQQHFSYQQNYRVMFRAVPQDRLDTEYQFGDIFLYNYHRTYFSTNGVGRGGGMFIVPSVLTYLFILCFFLL